VIILNRPNSSELKVDFIIVMIEEAKPK